MWCSSTASIIILVAGFCRDERESVTFPGSVDRRALLGSSTSEKTALKLNEAGRVDAVRPAFVAVYNPLVTTWFSR